MKFKVEKGVFAEQLTQYADELEKATSERLKQMAETIRLLEKSTIVLASNGQLSVIPLAATDDAAITRLHQLAIAILDPIISSLSSKYGKFRVRILKPRGS